MRRRPLLVGGASLLAAPAIAAAPALTAIGAEIAGNKAGSIPAYDGGGPLPPTDQPSEVLRAAQADDPRLTPGLAALLRQRPAWSLRVFPTRRSAAMPGFITRASAANLGRAALTDSGNGVEGAATGIPFPRPESGLQVIWNHMLRWRFQALERIVGVAAPQASGTFTLQRWADRTLYPYNTPDATPAELKGSASQLVMYRVQEPAGLAGLGLISRQPLDYDRDRTLYWFYNPAIKRVVLSTDTVFDIPTSTVDGLRTVDQADMFAGSPEMYTWTLLGKQERLVPYNSNTLYDPARPVAEIVRAGGLAPDLTRYELHRVWVVDAALKPGRKHRYARRTCYFDEDSWQMLLADCYDEHGDLRRVQEAHPIQYTGPVPSFYASIDVTHDLRSGRYAVFGLPNGEAAINLQPRLTVSDFTAEGLRAYAGR